MKVKMKIKKKKKRIKLQTRQNVTYKKADLNHIFVRYISLTETSRFCRYLKII